MDSASTPAGAWRDHSAYGRVPALELVAGDRSCTRLVVVSAHPDDESLGAGGLISVAADAGLAIYVVLLTAGEASPFASPDSTRHALATLRLAETENALARLAPDNSMVFLGAPDGQVSKSESQIASSLTDLLGNGTHTLLAAPWRLDGHDDHDAAGRAAAMAARASGARLVEYPLLAWTRCRPEDLPWHETLCLELTPELQERKSAAIRSHVSQVRPSGSHAGGQAPLPGRVLSHFAGPYEHYIEMLDAGGSIEP